LYLASKKLRERYRANALAISCFSLVLFGDFEQQIRAVLEGPLGISIR
jgi:hypothetical protein